MANQNQKNQTDRQGERPGQGQQNQQGNAGQRQQEQQGGGQRQQGGVERDLERDRGER